MSGHLGLISSYYQAKC